MLSPVSRSARWSRRSQFAQRLRGNPRHQRYDDHRQRKNQREPKSEAVWFPGHLSPLAARPKLLSRTFRGRNQERCVNYFTLAEFVPSIVTLLLHPSSLVTAPGRTLSTDARLPNKIGRNITGPKSLAYPLTDPLQSDILRCAPGP